MQVYTSGEAGRDEEGMTIGEKELGGEVLGDIEGEVKGESNCESLTGEEGGQMSCFFSFSSPALQYSGNTWKSALSEELRKNPC